MAKSSFTNSFQELQNQQRDRQKAVIDRQHELDILKRLDADQEAEISTCIRKTQLVENSHNDDELTNIDSKVKSCFLVINVLKSQFQRTIAFSNDLGRFIDGATFQWAEQDKKSLELEKRILDDEWTSKAQYFRDKISEIGSLHQSGLDSDAEQKRKLVSERDNIQTKNNTENEEIFKDYSNELNQSTQDCSLFEMNLNEQIWLNTELSKKPENANTKLEQLDLDLQEKVSALNHLKNSSSKWSKEFEIAFNEYTAQLKTILETSESTEEKNRIVKEGVSVLTDRLNMLLSEEADLQRELSEEETFLSDLQSKISAAAESSIDLLQKKEKLNEQIELFKKELLAVNHECSLLEEDNAHLVEKIQEKTCHYDEVLSGTKVTLEEITSQVANLESELLLVNETNSKLNAAVADNTSLMTENTEAKQRLSSLTTSEANLCKEIELSQQNLKNFGDELKSYNEELHVKIEKLFATSKEADTDIDSSNDKCRKLIDENNGLLTMSLEYKKQMCDLQSKTDERIEKIVADSQEKEKTINQKIVDINEKMGTARKNFKNLYDNFNSKYREKRNRLRATTVQIANMTEKLEASKKTEANIHQMLINELQADSEEADATTIPPLKKIKFSSTLEKFSPQLPSDLTQTPKSILKRKSDLTPDESLKRSKISTDNDNYFPSFLDD